MSSDSEKPAPTSHNSGIKNLVPFAPGVSGNPGGRPKTRHISQALREKLDSVVPESDKTYAEAIADRLCNAAVFAKRDSQAVQAAAEIADRTEGKAQQSVRFSQVIDPDAIARLNELAARLFLDADIDGYQFPHDKPVSPERTLPSLAGVTILDGETVFSEKSAATTSATDPDQPQKE